MNTQPRYWCGDVTPCNICNQPAQSVMYDAATRRGWGWLCPRCFRGEGCRLGTGVGQQYTKQDDGKYLKTGG